MRFTNKENVYLVQFVQYRMNYEDVNDLEIKNKLQSLIFKIQNNENIVGYDKNLLAGIVNEYYFKNIQDVANKFYDKDDVDLINLNNYELNELDRINDIQVLKNRFTKNKGLKTSKSD